MVRGSRHITVSDCESLRGCQIDGDLISHTMDPNIIFRYFSTTQVPLIGMSAPCPPPWVLSSMRTMSQALFITHRAASNHSGCLVNADVVQLN